MKHTYIETIHDGKTFALKNKGSNSFVGFFKTRELAEKAQQELEESIRLYRRQERKEGGLMTEATYWND